MLIKKRNIHWSFANLEQKHMLSSGCSALDGSITVCIRKISFTCECPLLFPSFILYIEVREREKDRFRYKENSVLHKVLLIRLSRWFFQIEMLQLSLGKAKKIVLILIGWCTCLSSSPISAHLWFPFIWDLPVYLVNDGK